MNLNLNEHKMTLGLAVLTAAGAYFLPFTHVSAGLATAIMGFLGTVNSIIQRYSMPPLGKPEVKP